jgi:rhamnogalacturonyl hydrolase YesR
MYLFYDHDARTFRTSHWNWSWGPAIKLLLESAEQAADTDRAARLRRVADDFGRASLNFQVLDEKHIAHGFSVVRWSPGLKNTRQAEYVSPSAASFPVAGWAPSHAGERFEAGYEGYVSPADTLYLAGWGWVPLGETNGNRKFTDASRLVVDASDRLLAQYEIIPQDLPLLVGEWTDYTREEAGFGVEGFAELYRVTRDEEHRRVGEKYIDGILDKLERPDGLWHRHWWRSRRTTTECEYKSRSLGWGEMGLQAAHRMSPERGYLEKAVKLAEHFLSAQAESGAWGLVINRPIGDTQESAKGTALWTMLLYRLHRLTGDKRHLESARRGLRWLLDQQYLGPDADGHGGVISCSPFSGVDYRRWFKLSCGYTSAFFGLAVLEEMRVSGQA